MRWIAFATLLTVVTHSVACSVPSEPGTEPGERSSPMDSGLPLDATTSAPASTVVRGEPSATVASSASSTVPVSNVETSAALRRGLWLWEFERNAPTAERSAELAAQWGVRRVFIKGSNGDLGPRWWKNASAENIERFTSRGIEVWLFGYFYAPDVPDADGRTWGTIREQTDAMMRVASAPGVTGVVVDAEEEFKGRPNEAVALCKALRARLEGKSLAYTSYGWLSPHKKFPFRELDRHCGDAFLPQVYYAFGWPGDVAGSLDRLEKEARALGLVAPLWPVQSNERDPSVERMKTFFDRVGPNGSVFYLHKDGSAQNEKLSKLQWR